MRNTILFLLAFCLLGSCSSVVTVQKAETILNKQDKIDTVVCITPDIQFFTNSIFSSLDYKKTVEFQPYFYKQFKRYSKKASSLNFKIYHPQFGNPITTDYFNSLLPLKNEIIEALFERNNDLNKTFVFGGKALQKSVFADVPKISPDYSHLSKKYGTPYFSWYGVFSANNMSVFAFAIVNVESMEVVIKEMVYIEKGINKRNLPPLMYDSFINIEQ